MADTNCGSGDAPAHEDDGPRSYVSSDPDATTPRMNALPWDDYFMSIALLSAARSKDPNTQVGACIVNPSKTIVAIGYNGMPIGCSDMDFPWARSGASSLDTKYPFVVHAEANAIMNRNVATLEGCTMYVALFPCSSCAKLIIQSRIACVKFLSDKYADSPDIIASKRLLAAGKVHTELYVPSTPGVVLDFRPYMS